MILIFPMLKSKPSSQLYKGRTSVCVMFYQLNLDNKIIQDTFHNDFFLKKKEHKGLREYHGNKGFLQLNTKYLTKTTNKMNCY